MAPLILEGENLGQKHRHYNKLLKEFLSKQDASEEMQKINYDEPDIENLFKIDVACNNKNVEYILEVLKCEDMLYVSRAIKRSQWLITDDKYTHIINPDYIHSKLLPQMASGAGHKFLLSIRLNLKNEERAEEFYRYYEDQKQLNMALKWLPKCSVPFIETIVHKHFQEIPLNLQIRLCEKSLSILEIYAGTQHKYNGTLRALISKTVFLLNKDPAKFLEIVNAQEPYTIPTFSPKSTQIIMKSCPEFVMKNFEKFAKKLDILTFSKCLKREDVKEFIMTHIQNEKLKSWFSFENMRHFVARMPSEGRFDFIKRVWIEKSRDTNREDFPCANEEENDCCYMLCSATQNVSNLTNTNIYRWYRFAPFSTAFTDLKKLIRSESSPNERNAMYAILMSCARRNLQNVQTLLQYYRDKHINEPFKFKSHFVNIVLSQSYSHRFDDKTWSILNDILYSMEVYSESENNVQICLKHIILYKVVNNISVPDIIENKFEFDTLKSFQSKLNKEEEEKVFKYLYQFVLTKIQNFTVTSELDLKEAKTHIINILNLISDWKKDLLEYNVILDNIKDLIESKIKNKWNEDLSDIYNVKKSWRKHMFKESLFLHPKQETIINVLKHGSQILTANKETTHNNESALLTQPLKKIRIYWPQSLAKNFEDTFLNQLSNKTKHKSIVKGLCILLPQKQLIEILNKYKPKETKINWAETDDVLLSIQKNIARFIYLARPQPPIQLVLLYGKGDYLQFALPSIHSVFYNMSIDQSVQHIPTLLDAPVSLQKHSLNFAFAKLESGQLVKIALNSWKSTKNASIRATIFKLVFDLLCKEKNENNIKEIWITLNSFMDALTPDENKTIYVTLSQISKVPHSIKTDLCVKSYRFLKSLPPKTHCDNIVESVLDSTLEIMEHLDVEFLSEIVFDSFDKNFDKAYNQNVNVISSSLISTKSVINQTQRYEKIFLPLFQKYLDFRNDTTKSQYNLKYNFSYLLGHLLRDLYNIVLAKNMITPIKLFNDIYLDLEKNFSDEQYYVMLVTWKLAAAYVKLIDTYRSKTENELDESKRDNLYLEVAPDFGEICMEYLRNDTKKYFASIFRLFSKGLKELFDNFQFNCKVQLKIIESMQQHADIIEGYLLVLKVLPKYINNDEDKKERSNIYKKIGSHSSVEVIMHYQQVLQENERFDD